MAAEDSLRIETLQRSLALAQEALRDEGALIAQKYVSLAQQELSCDIEAYFQCENGEAVVYAPQMVATPS